MTHEQERAIVECLNDVTVAIQILAPRLWELAGSDAGEAAKRCAKANERLFAAFPDPPFDALGEK